MKTTILALFLAFLFAVPARCEQAANSEYGGRPPMSVLDPEHSKPFPSESSRLRADSEARKFKWKMTAVLSLAALVPILVGISVMSVLLRRRGPAYFPNHTWQPRLGAPHAGGNHVVMNLGHPPARRP